MSKISNAMLTVEDLFMNAKANYEGYVDWMKENGFDENMAIDAAQAYGIMLGCASVNGELLGDTNLEELMDDMHILGKTKLYRSDFEKS